VGRAVHGVLQVIDLATGAGLEAAAAAQAAAEGVLGREELVADLARSALDSAPVRAAVASGRWWRELYVATDVGGTLLEGYVDLVYETPDGLVVVDYKTDAVPDDDALDAAMARYARQGGAYVLGVEQVTERPVVRCSFVFCGRGAARVVDLEDPRRWAAEVAGEVASLASAGPSPSRGASR
jgi:ATP-dependent exoDNAse (exonuclease V) beta subunit